MARIVRTRRHLIGHQTAVAEHEELDAEHADVIHALRQLLCARDGLPRERFGNVRRRHLRHREDSGAVQVLLHWQMRHGTVSGTCHDDADLER